MLDDSGNQLEIAIHLMNGAAVLVYSFNLEGPLQDICIYMQGPCCALQIIGDGDVPYPWCILSRRLYLNLSQIRQVGMARALSMQSLLNPL